MTADTSRLIVDPVEPEGAAKQPATLYEGTLTPLHIFSTQPPHQSIDNVS
jgi:hypothetical protein